MRLFLECGRTSQSMCSVVNFMLLTAVLCASDAVTVGAHTTGDGGKSDRRAAHGAPPLRAAVSRTAAMGGADRSRMASVSLADVNILLPDRSNERATTSDVNSHDAAAWRAQQQESQLLAPPLPPDKTSPSCMLNGEPCPMPMWSPQWALVNSTAAMDANLSGCVGLMHGVANVTRACLPSPRHVRVSTAGTMQHQHCNTATRTACRSRCTTMHCEHKFEWGSTCTHHNRFLVSTCMTRVRSVLNSSARAHSLCMRADVTLRALRRGTQTVTILTHSR
jgi:hypothetical protein